jgi:hypothetical protein
LFGGQEVKAGQDTHKRPHEAKVNMAVKPGSGSGSGSGGVEDEDEDEGHGPPLKKAKQTESGAAVPYAVDSLTPLCSSDLLLSDAGEPEALEEQQRTGGSSSSSSSSVRNNMGSIDTKGSGGGKNVCSKCGKDFVKPSNLIRHVRTVHDPTIADGKDALRKFSAARTKYNRKKSNFPPGLYDKLTAELFESGYSMNGTLLTSDHHRKSQNATSEAVRIANRRRNNMRAHLKEQNRNGTADLRSGTLDKNLRVRSDLSTRVNSSPSAVRALTFCLQASTELGTVPALPPTAVSTDTEFETMKVDAVDAACESEPYCTIIANLCTDWQIDPKLWRTASIETPTGWLSIRSIVRYLMQLSQICLTDVRGDVLLMLRFNKAMAFETAVELHRRTQPTYKFGMKKQASWEERNLLLWPETATGQPGESWLDNMKSYKYSYDPAVCQQLRDVIRPLEVTKPTLEIAAHYGSSDRGAIGAMLSILGKGACKDLTLNCVDTGLFAAHCCVSNAQARTNASGVSLTQGGLLFELTGGD